MSAVTNERAPFARMIECTEQQYHDDPCEVPSLNSSVAKEIIACSPLHGWNIHPKLGKQQLADAGFESPSERETKSKLCGKVCHRLLLGKGADIELIDFANYRKDDAKAAREAAKAAGRTPVLRHQMDEFATAADVLRHKISLKGYELDGESEVAIEWDEDGARGPIRCRGRMDHLRRHIRQVIDVKTIVSADPNTISRQIYDFGYHIQWRAYVSGVSKLLRVEPEDISYILLFCEVEPPYAVTPVDMALCGSYREMGSMSWERALFLWEEGLATNRWPEYTERAIGVEPPAYAMHREIGNVC